MKMPPFDDFYLMLRCINNQLVKRGDFNLKGRIETAECTSFPVKNYYSHLFYLFPVSVRLCAPTVSLLWLCNTVDCSNMN